MQQDSNQTAIANSYSAIVLDNYEAKLKAPFEIFMETALFQSEGWKTVGNRHVRFWRIDEDTDVIISTKRSMSFCERVERSMDHVDLEFDAARWERKRARDWALRKLRRVNRRLKRKREQEAVPHSIYSEMTVDERFVAHATDRLSFRDVPPSNLQLIEEVPIQQELDESCVCDCWEAGYLTGLYEEPEYFAPNFERISVLHDMRMRIENIGYVDTCWLRVFLELVPEMHRPHVDLGAISNAMSSISSFILKNLHDWIRHPLGAIPSIARLFATNISSCFTGVIWNAYMKDIVYVCSSILLVCVGRFIGAGKITTAIAHMVLTIAFTIGLNPVSDKVIITTSLINLVFVTGSAVSIPHSFDILPKLIFLLGAAVFGHMIPTSIDMNNLLLKFDRIPKAIVGLEKMSEMLGTAYEKVADFFYEYIYGNARPSISAIPDEVERHYAEVRAFDYDKMSQVPSNPALCAQLGDLWSRYMNFRRVYNDNVYIRNFLNSYQGTMKTFYDKSCSTNPKPMEQRVKPVCLMLYGGSGVGKSTILNYLMAHVLKLKGIIRRGISAAEAEIILNSAAYSRNITQKHWDRYENQIFTIYDDIFQTKDHDAVPNEQFEELIHVVNGFPLPLPMADLSQKSNTYFRSDFVFCTTNLNPIVPKSIVEPSAVKTRLHLAYAVRVKKQFRKCEHDFTWDMGKNEKFGLDVEKLYAATGKRMDLSVYEIYKYDPFTGIVDESKSYTFDQVADAVWNAHLVHKEVKEQATQLILRHFDLEDEAQPHFANRKPNDKISVDEMRTFQDLLVHFPIVREWHPTGWQDVVQRCQQLDPVPEALIQWSETMMERRVLFRLSQFPIHLQYLLVRLADVSRMPRPVDPYRVWGNHWEGEDPGFILGSADDFAFLADTIAGQVSMPHSIDFDAVDGHWFFAGDDLARRPASWCEIVEKNWGVDHEYSQWCRHYLPTLGNTLMGAQEFQYRMRPSYVQRKYHAAGVWLSRWRTTNFQSMVRVEDEMIQRVRNRLTDLAAKTCEFAQRYAHLAAGMIAVTGVIAAAYWMYGKYKGSGKETLVPVKPSKPEGWLFSDDEMPEDVEVDAEFYASEDGKRIYIALSDNVQIGEGTFQMIEREGTQVWLISRALLYMVFDVQEVDHEHKYYDVKGHLWKQDDKRDHLVETKTAKTSWEQLRVYISGDSILESGTSKVKSVVRKLESGPTKTPVTKVRLESGTSKQPVRQIRLENATKSVHRTDLEMKMFAAEVKAKSEAFASNQALEMTRKIRAQYGWIKKNGVYVAPIFCVGAHMAITNKHYWDRVPSEFDYVPPRSNAIYKIRKSEIQCRPYARAEDILTDFVVLLLPSILPKAANVTSLFIDTDQLSKLKGSRFVMISPALYNDGDGTKQTFSSVSGTIDRVQSSERPLPSIGVVIKATEVISNDCPSQPGDCLAAYVLDDDRFRGKVCALHFAGPSSGGSVGQLFTREDLQRYEINIPHSIPFDCQAEQFPLDGVIKHSVVQAPSQPMKTSFVRTPIADFVEDTNMAPAVLEPMLKPDGVALKGLAKVTEEVCDLDETVMALAYEDLKSTLMCGTPHQEYEKRVLTIEEAVQGVPNAPYVKAINRSRSPGYPWCLQPGGTNGKRKWCSKSDDTFEFGEPFQPVRDAVERHIESAKKGICESVVFQDALKDETRPVVDGKVKKTRVFSMAPMDFVIVFRMYFLGFMSYLMRNRIRNEIAVGIQAQSVEWDMLAKHLRSKGDACVAGDFSDYDGRLNPRILIKFCEMANEWYNDEFSLVRSTLFEHVMHSYHVCGPFLYQWTHSQPSGNPATAIINSFANSLMCRYVYYDMKPEGAPRFSDAVAMISYGDDNVLNISQRVIGWYHQLSMTEGFKKLGMVYTDTDKNQSAREWITLPEASFLKRGFRWSGSLWVGPLEKRSILNRLVWMKRGNDVDTLLENAEVAVAELSLWDEKTFQEESKKIQTIFLEQLNRSVSVFPQGYYLELVLKGKMCDAFPFMDYV